VLADNPVAFTLKEVPELKTNEEPFLTIGPVALPSAIFQAIVPNWFSLFVIINLILELVVTESSVAVVGVAARGRTAVVTKRVVIPLSKTLKPLFCISTLYWVPGIISTN
jgi:hypothetical protein